MTALTIQKMRAIVRVLEASRQREAVPVMVPRTLAERAIREYPELFETQPGHSCPAFAFMPSIIP